MSEGIEVTVARLDERMKGFHSVLEDMAQDQRKMAESYAKLVESNQRISLIELDLVNVKKSVDAVWGKLNGIQLVKEKTFREWSLMAGSQMLGMVILIALYHFGIKS